MKFKFFVFIGFLFLFFSCKKKDTLFELKDSDETGIEFENRLVEKDTSNILDNEFFYNGGGVAVGDLNNDGLQDIYFAGNQVKNKLYINKGNLKFEDITDISGAQKSENQWSSGVSIVDVNSDGLQDIYVCNSQNPQKDKLKNNLFINQGIDKNGNPTFKDLASEYGLAGAESTTSCQFFDYDNDGDLDVFVAVNVLDVQYPNQFSTKILDGSSSNPDKLYRNDFSESLNHPVFKDVSKEAGIVWPGYSHSCLINDFNADGWQDIYVANDYVSNDLVFINKKDGTFENRAKDVFKHQSFSAMGSDVADINNDGLLDIFTTEMLPYTNKRKKLFLSGNTYTTYIFNEQYGYEYQYFRNTLQLNQGLNPETGLNTFSDISFLAGVNETDWSWTSLFADFDNDGSKDIFVTNGFPKDVADHDFAEFRKHASHLVSTQELYNQIPEIKSPNFIFKNDGNLQFSDKTKEWGLEIPSFSNGAAYADFDNDGDLEIVINNINDKAFFYENKSISIEKENEAKNAFLRVSLKGEKNNVLGFGSEVCVYANGEKQIVKIESNRGYLSKSENIAHFGLGNAIEVDSVEVKWSNNKITILKKIKINQNLLIDYSKSIFKEIKPIQQKYLVQEIKGKDIGLDFIHQENDFIDFNFQRTLPHKFSQYGPSLTVGDVNGDKLDDIFIGGSSRYDEVFYVQMSNGTFKKKLSTFKTTYQKKEEDMGSLLFDADNDGDNDLYIVRGSYQHDPGTPMYNHVLCVNDGKGNFKVDTLAINNLRMAGSAIKAADIDNDGDLDLFVSGHVKPHNFPEAEQSRILRNDSKLKDHPKFTDISLQMAPALKSVGMINDAIFSDFDNDNKIDLILAGEWSNLIFFKNTGKAFVDISKSTGINDKLGWWTSISGSDIDHDGDIDYVAGNYGLNTYFKASSEFPLTLYAKDFDKNGNIEPFISCFWRDSTDEKHEYFFHSRDDMSKQLPLLQKKFNTYGQFGSAQVKDVFTKEEMLNVKLFKTNYLNTSFIENLGNGKFKIKSLPIEAQLAPIFGILMTDLNQDGFDDLLLNGNDYGMELLQGRADAFNGLVLLNKGKSGGFIPVNHTQAGFFVPYDGKALVKIASSTGNLILAAQNKHDFKVFKLDNSRRIEIGRNEAYAMIEHKNHSISKKEFYFGGSFLSQNSRFLEIEPTIFKVSTFSSSGNKIKEYTF